MLHENIKRLRTAKGLSQEELATKLNVVRQTVSKWEKGLSVPDSNLLIRLAEELDTTVNELLGEPLSPESPSELQTIAAKLELLNEQLAKYRENRRRSWRAVWIAVVAIAAIVLIRELVRMQSVVSLMDSVDASMAIIGGADGPTAIAVARTIGNPFLLVISILVVIGAIIGIVATRKK